VVVLLEVVDEMLLVRGNVSRPRCHLDESAEWGEERGGERVGHSDTSVV
jgi:hypothetical protein